MRKNFSPGPFFSEILKHLFSFCIHFQIFLRFFEAKLILTGRWKRSEKESANFESPIPTRTNVADIFWDLQLFLRKCYLFSIITGSKNKLCGFAVQPEKLFRETHCLAQLGFQMRAGCCFNCWNKKCHLFSAESRLR